MFLNKKGQITIEFIIILGVILIFIIYFSSAIFPIIQIDKSIYLVKQNALDIISEQNYPTTISSINFNLEDDTLNLFISFNKNNGPLQEDISNTLLNTDNYKNTTDYIKQTGSYDDVKLILNYN
jgi:uncharacterized protein (UPF0333 family)